MTTAAEQEEAHSVLTPADRQKIDEMLDINGNSTDRNAFVEISQFIIHKRKGHENTVAESMPVLLELLTKNETIRERIRQSPNGALDVFTTLIANNFPPKDRLDAWQKMMATDVMQDAGKTSSSCSFLVTIMFALPDAQKLAAWKFMIANPDMQQNWEKSLRQTHLTFDTMIATLTPDQLQEAGIVTREIRPGDVEHDTRERYSGSVYVVPHDLLPKALQANTGESQTIIRFDDMQMTADQWANHWGAYKKGTRTIVRGSMA
ncbi:MAG: hypothetical protein EBQ89_08180, partial [Alphaproteobacteria bacterium]|nr:hypothetical protein [Alphaproteobacteria bacterium]